MGIGIDPHANHLCRLFGFSEIYPIGSHFGSWYISRIIYSILISTEYRKLAALVNLQLWKEKNCKYVKPNEIFHRLISRTAEKEEDSEKKAEQNVETKLDRGKQEKKENAVERSGENIRTDSAEEALPYELVIVEAEKK